MLTTILRMIAAIGCLLVGFELLSNNVTKLFHKGLKKLFNKTSKSRFLGVGIGAATTAIMQSSAATTIIVVGFVNTGVMDLFQATSIIMGANIGTTITAQIAALNAFDFQAYVIALAGIGVFIKMFAKGDKIKTLGLAIAGFGLLFFGLLSMNEAVKNETVYAAISDILTKIDIPIVLFLLGIVLTAAVQSSALITTIIITLASTGIYIGAGADAVALNNNVLYLILGTNIGTCVTALISSIGASTNAKRAAFIHLMFNTVGAILFIILFICWPSFMEKTFDKWFPGVPGTQIAMFHTFFNVVCTFVFLPFIKIFVATSETIIKDKPKKSKKANLKFIDERLLKSPSVAIHMTRNELGIMYDKAYNVMNKALEGFFNRDVDVKEMVDKENQELELDSKGIIEFLVKLSDVNLPYEDECTLSSFHHTLNDILRIGEIGDNICKYTRQMVEEELQFSENVIVQISFMRQTINNLYDSTADIFLSKDLKKLPASDEIEESIDVMRKELIDDHFDRLNKGECKPQNSAVFVNLVNNLERAADHMNFIAHSVEDAYKQSQNK